jgi:hypothetical protein
VLITNDSMSFGGSPFIGHVGNTQEIYLKIQEIQQYKYPREEAQSPEESRPKQLENRPITKANHFNSAPNPHGLSHNDQGRRPTEDGHVWAQPGCGRPHP